MQLLSLILMILVQITERLCSGILMIWDDIFIQCTIFQVSAINNINAMLAQATSSIRNENESLLAGKKKIYKYFHLGRISTLHWGSIMAHSVSAVTLGGLPAFKVLLHSLLLGLNGTRSEELKKHQMQILEQVINIFSLLFLGFVSRTQALRF